MRLLYIIQFIHVDQHISEVTSLTNFVCLQFQAKLETKALKAKRPGFTDERYNETSYYLENGKFIHIILLLTQFSLITTPSQSFFKQI